MKTLLALLILFSAFSAKSMAWDEPWQIDIIKEADYFFYGKVISVQDTQAVVHVEKSIGGTLAGDIMIAGCFMLDLCEGTKHDTVFLMLQKGDEGYFMLKKGERGKYQMPTPSSGFDLISDTLVIATYRHTFHQAMILPELYEFTYKQIWNKHHLGTYDMDTLQQFFDTTLAKPPAAMSPEERITFFEQHVALETAYLLGYEYDFERLQTFVESKNVHLKISGLRAMSCFKRSKPVTNYLLEYIRNAENDNFTKVIAIWSIWEQCEDDYKKQLWMLREELDQQVVGWGVRSNDPRYCTYFPSPYQALWDLTDTGE